MIFQNFNHRVVFTFLILFFFTELSMAQSERDSLSSKPAKEKKIKYPRSYGGITFTRIDWGISRVMDDGSFSLSEENEFLEYGRASNFGFDVAQFGVRFTDKFKVYLSTGFEWNYLRLKKNILLNRSESPLDYREIDEDEVDFSKNILTSTYLRIPLTVELRTKRFSNGRRMKFAFGPMTGVLLKGTQRLKSEVNGKQKFKNNYNLAQFQYGAFARIGYGLLGVFGKYYMNSFFDNSPEQKQLHNLAFGATLGF